MSAPEAYLHPVESRLPKPFIKSLVDAKLLPFDISFRSQWLPDEIFDGNEKRILRSEILDQDILAATGHIEPTKYYETYLSASAEPPSCVTISTRQNVKATLVTTSLSWHSFSDYREILEESGMRYVDAKAQATWLQLMLATLHHTQTTLDWLGKSDPGDLAKRTQAGEWLRNRIARTVIHESGLLYLTEAPHIVPDTTIKANQHVFNGLHLLLARDYPTKYSETYEEWQQATEKVTATNKL